VQLQAVKIALLFHLRGGCCSVRNLLKLFHSHFVKLCKCSKL